MSQEPPDRLRFPVIPFVVLGVSLLLTALAALYVGVVTTNQDRARFDLAIERTQNAISSRIETYVNLLRGGAGMFAALDMVTHKQFRAYVNRLRISEQYPGIQGIGISARVLPHQMPDIMQRMREDGFKDFKIKPDHPREEYHLILYLEPLDRRNAAAIGYDMFTDPTRQTAMVRARDTGKPATSGKVTLVQEIEAQKQAGFLIYVPIYYLGGIPETVELRRMLLAGFVYAPFRADDLLRGIIGDGGKSAGVSISVYDDDANSPAALLHQSDPAAAATSARDPRFTATVPLEVPGGRRWMIVYRSGKPFETSYARRLSMGVLAAGTIVSLLLFALSLAQARAKQSAERSAADLRASESKFRRLADANLVGVAFTKADGRIVDGNDELFRILGRRRSDALAGRLRWDQTTAPQYRERDKDANEQLATRGVCAPYEKEYIREDGSRVPVMIGLARLEESDDRVALVIDLTSRVAAERAVLAAKEAADEARRQAEEASRLKDDFLATVSHELRTPLNAIFGWAQLLRSGHGPAEEHSHGLETIERAARAQAQLIDDLLDVSRIVAGKLRLDMQHVALASVIEAAVASIRPTADAKGVEIISALDPALGPVDGDPQRIQQIVWNLLANAVKFTPRGGSARVSLQRTATDAVITVTDTGIGLAPAFLPHIFERFRQADPSSTRIYGGLGLGLAIVRHLVELHGGSVEAHSEGEGKGATFCVTLPLALLPTPRTASTPPASNGDSLQGVRVLLVEDDADARELTVQLLRQRGAIVTATSSAADAIASIEQAVPDIVLSDIGMPNEDGYMLLAKIRSLPADRGGAVPVVAITALARPEDRRRALLAGFQTHIAKPVDANELTSVVAKLAGERREPQQV